MAPNDWGRRLTDQQATIEQLREVLQVTHSRYQAACRKCDAAMAVARDVGEEHPDGNFGVRKAVQEFNFALKEYQAALRLFTDYVMGENRH